MMNRKTTSPMDSKVNGGTIAFSEQTISMAEGSEIPRIEPNLRTTNEFTSPARFGVDDGEFIVYVYC